MNTNLGESIAGSFTPAPWCTNGHVHTIGCSLLNRPIDLPAERVEISTPDEDFLELDIIDQGSGKAVIALFHGLEGSTDRYYMQKMMNILIEHDYATVAVNFRSCGSRINRRRRFYHSGETSDYMTVFNWIKNRFNNARTGAVGFSLGGNALLKSLGEEGKDHPVDAAVAVSCPFDLKLGAKIIAQGFNRIYEYRFLRTLKWKLDKKRQVYPDLPKFTGKTLYDFDDQVTSKIHGFKDADDYYEKCSARHFVSSICKSTMVIHSREDPICPVEAVPLKNIQRNRSLDHIITDRGGHVGYWGKPKNWLFNSIVNYINSHI